MSQNGSVPNNDRESLRKAALEYHEFPVPGKLSVTPTKQLTNQRDLALAYSPGVAASSEEIVADPVNVFRYTARGNLVAVITDGTAVLGLGAIGPLAAKPVMEGKAVLFKEFAGIDVFDIEVDQRDPDKLIEVIAALEPTFGGINLEDIKAPECFYVERELRKRMKIPVFHDDQHGTAIIVVAAVLNGLQVVGKRIDQVKLVVSGAGAAALACVDLLVDVGLPSRNVWLTDLAGVVWKGRTELMDPDKARFAQETDARTLAEVIGGADLFLGLSAGGVLKPEMVAQMAPRPLIFALANPTPEILPEEAKAVRNDAVIATGRTDYPNQVNNVLCFPFLFRGALDRRTCAPGSQRNRRQRLWHTGPLVRSRISDSQAFRSAPDRANRAGRGEGGDGLRRREQADRRLRRLPPASATVRLPQRHADEADLRCRAYGRVREEPHHPLRGRGRARAARGSDSR
jgi:malate dehydrogenase (oxaloacetate-decarboxylating)(NADP+)